MVFKQGISKQNKFNFIVFFLVITLGNLVFLLLAKEEFLVALQLIVFFESILVLSGLFFLLLKCEWYHIYEDRIEVNYIFGTKNTVHFKDVLFIEEIGMLPRYKRFSNSYEMVYFFNDGRKNNNNIFDYNSFNNNKKLNLRIIKTPQLEKYVTEVLKIEIKKEK